MLAEPGWDRGSAAGPRSAGPIVMRRRRRRSDRPLFGILLLAVGVVWLLNVTIVNLTSETILSVLLMLLGLGMVFTGRRGGKGWPLLLGLVLIVGLVGSSTSLNLNVPATAGLGDRTFIPTSAAELLSRYRLSAGNLTIDLSQLPKDTGPKTITVVEGFGNVVITVPADAGVKVTARVGAGQLALFDRKSEQGLGVRDTYTTPNFDSAKTQLTLLVRDAGGKVTVRTPVMTPCVTRPGTCATQTPVLQTPATPLPPSPPAVPTTLP